MKNKSMKKLMTLLCTTLMSAALLTACAKTTEAPAESGASAVEEAEQTEAATEEGTEMEETAATEETTELPAADAPAAPTAGPEAGAALSSIRVYGVVKEMQDGMIYIENDNPNDMYGQINLNVTEETLILDAVDAETKTIADIEKGDTLYAYVSPAMTRSLPPMSNAELILCDIPQDIGVPEYAEIIAVQNGENGISLETNREIIYHISEETEIIDFATGESADVSKITEGSKVLAWYQIVLQSLPAQTTPDKIMIME